MSADAIAPKIRTLLENLLQTPVPVRLRAWDRSEAGPAGPPVLVIRDRRALRRLLWQPNELGMARAYVAGEIDVEGDLYDALGRLTALIWRAADLGRPPVRAVAADQLRLGILGPRPKPPPEEMVVSGIRHSRHRDRQAATASAAVRSAVSNAAVALRSAARTASAIVTSSRLTSPRSAWNSARMPATLGRAGGADVNAGE